MSAGLGVTGEWRDGLPTNPAPGPDWAYNAQRRRWERGLSFPTWVKHSIPAHIGRLLAYALTDAQVAPFPTDNDPELHRAQRAAIAAAVAVRPLPAVYRGIAPALDGLDGRWAVSRGYGERIAGVANVIRSMPI